MTATTSPKAPPKASAVSPTLPRCIRHAWRRLVFALSMLFVPVRWLWGTVLLGGLGVAILAGLAQTGIAGVSHWVVFVWLDAHREEGSLYGGIALMTLLAITYVTWQARRVPFVRAWRSNYRPILVSELSLSRLQFNLGATVHEGFYFHRDTYKKACDDLRRVRRNQAQGRRGILIIGDTMVGKTRLALEVIREVLPDYELLVWPRRQNTELASLDAFRNMRLVVLFDDLQSFVEGDRASNVQEALDRLQDVTPHLVIVATSWGGSYWERVSTSFQHLREYVIEIALKKLDDHEAQVFFADLDRAGIPYDRQDFDGTPGSVLLGLKRRIDQLEDMKAKNANTLAILKSLRLLRSANTISFPQSRVQRVAREVFLKADGDKRVRTIPQRAYDMLRDDGWLTITDWQGKRFLSVPADAYLDKCVKAVYPGADAHIEDDFERLQIALSSGGVEESDALFALSDAYLDAGVFPTEVRYARALSALETGLRPLDATRHRDLWIDGQLKLARVFRDSPSGDMNENHKHAWSAYSAALAVATQGLFPADLATPASVMHSARFRQKVNERASIAETAIEAIHMLLQDTSPQSTPRTRAGLQSNLGALYLYRRRGRLAENITLALECFDAALAVYATDALFSFEAALARTGRAIALLAVTPSNRSTSSSRAAQDLSAALSVIEDKGNDFERALVLTSRGTVYAFEGDADQRDALRLARRDFDQALALLGRAAVRAARDYQADRGLLYVKYGMADVCLAQEQEDLRHAINMFDTALEILKQEDFRLEWSLANGYRGIAYSLSLTGYPPLDPTLAARDLETALRALPFEQYPYEWALMSWHLGVAYEAAPGDRDKALTAAEDAYEASLAVFDREAFPTEWAITQQALGTMWLERLTELKASDQDNAAHAQAAYAQALQVLSRETNPAAWAALQSNLGEIARLHARDHRELGDAEEYLRHALEVFTPRDFPLEAAAARNNLGVLYLQAGKAGLAIDLLRGALQTLTYLELPRQRAIVQNNLSAALAIDAADAPGRNSDLLEEASALNAEAKELLMPFVSPRESDAVLINAGLLQSALRRQSRATSSADVQA